MKNFESFNNMKKRSQNSKRRKHTFSVAANFSLSQNASVTCINVKYGFHYNEEKYNCTALKLLVHKKFMWSQHPFSSLYWFQETTYINGEKHQNSSLHPLLVIAVV